MQNREYDQKMDEDGEFNQNVLKLMETIERQPFIYYPYIELIKLFKESGDFEELHEIRQKFSDLYPLSAYIWIEWIKDEIKINSYLFGEMETELVDEGKAEYVKDQLSSLFERAVIDYQSVDIWLEYAQFGIGQMSSPISGGLEKPREIFEAALKNCGLHVTQGAILWEGFREFEAALLSGYESRISSIYDQGINEAEIEFGLLPLKNELSSQIKRVFNLFKRQLAIPLLGMEATLKEFKEWIKIYSNDIAPSEISVLQLNYESAQTKLAEILEYEDMIHATRSAINNLQITLSDNKGQEPQSYRRDQKHKKEELKMVLRDHYLTYIEYETNSLFGVRSSSINKSNSTFKSSPARISCLYERAISECPLDSKLWCQYIIHFISGKLSDSKAAKRQALKAARNFATTLTCLAYQPPAATLAAFEDNNKSSLKLGVDGSNIDEFTNDLANIWITILESYEHEIGDDLKESIDPDDNNGCMVSETANEPIAIGPILPTVPVVSVSRNSFSTIPSFHDVITDITQFTDTKDLLQLIRRCGKNTFEMASDETVVAGSDFARDTWLRLALRYCCELPLAAIINSKLVDPNSITTDVLTDSLNGFDNSLYDDTGTGVSRFSQQQHALKRTQKDALFASLKLCSHIWMSYLEHMRRHLFILENKGDSALAGKIDCYKDKFKHTFDEALNYFDQKFRFNNDLTHFGFSLASAHQYEDAILPLYLYAATAFAYLFRDKERSTTYWDQLIKLGGSSFSYNWIEWYNCEKFIGDIPNSRKILQRALSYTTDNPEWIIETIIRHDRIYGCAPQAWRDSKKKLIEAQARADDRKRRLADMEKEAARDKKRHKSSGGTGGGGRDDNSSRYASRDHKTNRSAKRYSNSREQGSAKENSSYLLDTSETAPNLNSDDSKGFQYQPQSPNIKPNLNLTEAVLSSPTKDSDGFAIPTIPRAYKKQKPVENFVNNSTDITVSLNDPQYISINKGIEEGGDIPFDEGTNITNTGPRLNKDFVVVAPHEERMIDYSLIPERTLFLSNLSFKATERELDELFCKYGTLENVHIVTTRKGKSKGYAYLVFVDASSATKALGADRIKLKERPVFVSRYGKRFKEKPKPPLSSPRLKFATQDSSPGSGESSTQYNLADKYQNTVDQHQYSSVDATTMETENDSTNDLPKSGKLSKLPNTNSKYQKSGGRNRIYTSPSKGKDLLRINHPKLKLDLKGGGDLANRFLPRHLKTLVVSDSNDIQKLPDVTE